MDEWLAKARASWAARLALHETSVCRIFFFLISKYIEDKNYPNVDE